MSPLTILSIAFVNVLLGTFSKRLTMAMWIGLFAVIISYFAYQYPSQFLNPADCSIAGMACGTAQDMSITWGLFSLLPLWFIGWLGKVMHSLT